MRLVLFDIDGTLVTGPGTEQRFFLQLLRGGRIGPRRLLAFLWFALRWLPRFGRHVFKKNKAYLAGLAPDDCARLARDWVSTGLGNAWFTPAVQRLREHLEAGDRVVLMSGTPQFLAEAIAAQLGVGEAIGSLCAAADDRFRAAPPLRHPFGPDKAELARRLCRDAGIRPEDTVAYADSGHDLVLLEWVGRPVAVRPDARLAGAAASRGWPVIGQRERAGPAGAASQAP